MMINHNAREIIDIPSSCENGPNFGILDANLALEFRPQMNAFQEMVRTRIRERVQNASVLARFLKEDPSTITKRLKAGGPSLCLDFLDQLREFFGGWTPAEMVAETGSSVQTITPVEAAILGLVRQMTELERRSLLTILERPAYNQSPYAKKSRLGRAMLTVKEQELVDLFARVKRDGVRDGVLETLRGAAKDDDQAGQAKGRTP